jgi:hypothetical protein
MALPATDTFTGTDWTPLETYSASWSIRNGGFLIYSNAVCPVSTFVENGAWWNADVFADDQYATGTFTAVGTSSQGLAVRVNTAADNSYYGYYSSDVDSRLFKVVAGTWTQLGSAGAPWAVNDVVRLEISGTSLRPMVNGVTADIGVQTDSDLTSGAAGLSSFSYFDNINSRLDNWEGGNLGGTAYTLTAEPGTFNTTMLPAYFPRTYRLTLRAAGASANGTTSVTVAQPTGTLDDDILVAFIVDRATSGSSAAPTGWTRQGGAAGTGGRFQVFTAVKGRNSLSGTSWAFAGLTTRAQGRMIGYRNGNPFNPLNGTPTASINASGTTGTTALTTSVNLGMIIAGFASLANGSLWSAEAVASGPTLTERADSANSTFLSLAIADGTQTTAGSTGASSATMATAGANAAILVGLAIKVDRFLGAAPGLFRATTFPATLSKGGGAGGNVLTATQASFSVAMQPANLLHKQVLSAAQQSYALTGQAANLLFKHVMSAVFGSFAESGQAANLLNKHVLPAVKVDFALAGQAVTLTKTGVTQTLTAAYAQFNLTGQSAALLSKHVLAAAQGSFVETGQAANLLHKHVLPVVQATFAVSVQTSGLLWKHVLPATKQNYTLTGQTLGLLHGRRLVAVQQAYNLTGQAAGLLWGRWITAVFVSYALSGQDVTLTKAALILSPGNIVLHSSGTRTTHSSGQASSYRSEEYPNNQAADRPVGKSESRKIWQSR